MSDDHVENVDPIDFALYEAQFKEAPLQEGLGKVDDDTYIVVVDKVYPTRAKSSGNPLIKWEMSIVSGTATGTKYAGRKLFRNNMMATSQNMSWLKTDFFKAGVQVDTASGIPEGCKKLVGKTLKVQKKTQGNNDSIFIQGVVSQGDASTSATTEALGEFAGAEKKPTPAPGPVASEDAPF